MADATLICASTALGEGKGFRFDVAIGNKACPAFVVRFAGETRGYLNICPHLGTELDWQPGQFFDDAGLYLICATHGAVFLPDSGYCVGGPCKGRKLSGLPIVERNGNIFLAEGFLLYVE